VIDARLLDAERETLRAKVREARDAIPGPERLRRAEMAYARLDDLPPFREAGTILLYYNVASQFPTLGLIRRLVEGEGRRVLLPFLRSGDLRLTEWRPSDPVVDAPYTGMEPRFKQVVPDAEADVAIVPGLAFDPDGYRLGEGAGHHDRLLVRLRPDAVSVGLCYAEQLFPSVPHGRAERPVRFVVTEDQTLACPQTA
jgi:5-formyltetrahydrofolate cyclo-ligase